MKFNSCRSKLHAAHIASSATLAAAPFWRTSFGDVAPRLRSGPRATNAFCGRPAREYARQVQPVPMKRKSWLTTSPCSAAPVEAWSPQRAQTANSSWTLSWRPAWPRLKEALDGLGNAPVKYAITPLGTSTIPITCASSRRRSHGLAHETLRSACPSRMTSRSCIESRRCARRLAFRTLAAEALPQRTFATVTSCKPMANLALQHVLRTYGHGRHVIFREANVISMGDLFFQRHVSYIDPGTGGKSPVICRRRQNSLARPA